MFGIYLKRYNILNFFIMLWIDTWNCMGLVSDGAIHGPLLIWHLSTVWWTTVLPPFFPINFLLCGWIPVTVWASLAMMLSMALCLFWLLSTVWKITALPMFSMDIFAMWIDTWNCMGLVSNGVIHGPLFMWHLSYSVMNNCFNVPIFSLRFGHCG